MTVTLEEFKELGCTNIRLIREIQAAIVAQKFSNKRDAMSYAFNYLYITGELDRKELNG